MINRTGTSTLSDPGGADKMRITCVMGPFLPVPPLLGGAIERIFIGLCNEFARIGHEVTMISRRFDGLPHEEVVSGVRHIRLKSSNAPGNKILYRLCDSLYAARVCAALPESDVTITHSVFLPMIIPRKRAGKIYVSVGRFPKGQMRLYRRADRLQAVSTHVADAIANQTPSVRHLVKVVPYALGGSFSEAITDNRGHRQKEILFVGRIAREKGVDLLLRAFVSLAGEHPGWRLSIVGPHEISHGGDGSEFLRELQQIAEPAAERIEFVGPVFSESKLIERLKKAEIFVYPSTAELGESFGMAPLEAMACGCAVIVSSLKCFEDFLVPAENGLRFDHTDPTGKTLATELRKLIAASGLRNELARRAIETGRAFGADKIARRYIDDFVTLTSVTRA